MSTNIAKLKSTKGAPPAADFTPDVIRADERSEDATMRPIQFRVPESVFAEFSERAGREFGFNKLALGHNLDDAVETFFMNLFFTFN